VDLAAVTSELSEVSQAQLDPINGSYVTGMDQLRLLAGVRFGRYSHD
jgi:hypothetical protein